MSDTCAELLKRLPTMPRPDLQELWQELFGKAPHPQVRRQLLVPIIAYRIQEKAHGGMHSATRNYLSRLAQQLEGGVPPPSPRIKPGTKLIRQWHGETHEVVVTENGNLYRGAEYKTLTEIASLITGSHWSGPKFFGLRNAKKAQ